MGTERRFNQMSAIWEAAQASKSENDKDFNVAFFFIHPSLSKKANKQNLRRVLREHRLIPKPVTSLPV